jgi:hypothetical protein
VPGESHRRCRYRLPLLPQPGAGHRVDRCGRPPSHRRGIPPRRRLGISPPPAQSPDTNRCGAS